MRKKYVLSLLLVLALSLGVLIPLAAGSVDERSICDDLYFGKFNESLEEHFINEFGEEFLSNLEQSRIYDAAIVSLFPRTRAGETMYPDYIGGIYYNSDGNLVLQIVQCYDVVMREEYSTLYQISELNILTNYVQFSYNYLNELMYIIGTSYKPCSFQWAGTDIAKNRVIVGLYPYSEYEISRFLETTVSSYAILFEETSNQFNNWILPYGE